MGKDAKFDKKKVGVATLISDKIDFRVRIGADTVRIVVFYRCIDHFVKHPHPFLIKMLNKLNIEKDFFNLLKGMFEKLTSSIIPIGERPCKIKNKERIAPLTASIHIILKVLADKERRKKRKGRLERNKNFFAENMIIYIEYFSQYKFYLCIVVTNNWKFQFKNTIYNIREYVKT